MANALVRGLMVPSPFMYASSSVPPTFGTILMDAAAEKAGWIVQAPKAGAIRQVGFRVGAVTTAVDTDVRLETVDLATGLPTGTLFGATTNVTVASAAITANTWIQTGNLTADATVARGDLLAVSIAPTGTPNYEVNTFVNGATPAAGMPYTVQWITGVWAKTARIPLVSLQYSDGSYAYMPGVMPVSAINTHTFNNAATPDEYALRAQLPGPVSVAGVWFAIDSDGDFDVAVYNSAGTEVETRANDADIDSVTAGHMPHFVWFAASEAMGAAAYFRFAIRPTSATNLSIYSIDVNTAAVFDQMEGGQLFNHSTRVDAGTWTDVLTRRLIGGLILDGIDDGAAGGASYQLANVSNGGPW